MAFRISNKINSPLVNTIMNKQFSVKCRIETDASKIKSLVPLREDVATANEPTSGASNVAFPGITLVAGKYHVCRPREMPFTSKRAVHNEMDVARKAAALQQLQPSMMTAYYSKPFANQITNRSFGFITEEQIKGSARKLKKMEESTAKRHVSTTVKPPKPTNPFPEPVTVLPTHAVLQPLWPLPNVQSRTMSTVHYRRYSPVIRRHSDEMRRLYRRISPVKKKVITFVPKNSRKALGIFSYSDFKSPEQLYATSTVDFDEDVDTPKPRKIVSPYPSYSEAWKEKLFADFQSITTTGIETRELRPFVHYFHTSSMSLAEKKKDDGKPKWISGNKKKPCVYKEPVDDMQIHIDRAEARKKRRQEEKKKPTGKKKASDSSNLPMTLTHNYTEEKIAKYVNEMQNMIRNSTLTLPKEINGWLGLCRTKPVGNEGNMKRLP